MDPTIVMSLLLGLIAVLLGAFYIKQGIDEAEMKRAVKVAHHQKNATRLVRALDALPPQYSNTKLKQFVLEEVQRELAAILQITPKNDAIQRELSVIQERLSQLTQDNGNSHNAVDIKTLEEANSIRICAQTLLKITHQRYQENLLSKDIAQYLSNHLKRVIAQTALDLYLYKAKSFEIEKKYQMALPFYQRALQELIKHPYIEKHQELTMMAKEKLKLMHSMEEREREREKEAANDQPTLDEGVNDLLEEEDQKWKKKYF